MQRHENGEARVIPIILREVDWSGAPFSKLQALPKDGKPVTNWDTQDEVDSQALYRLLEEEVVPLYYDRDTAGIPHNWVRVMKVAMRTSIAAFSMRRMIKEYVEEMYLPAMR